MQERLIKIGGLCNLFEVVLASDYGIDGVVEYRKTRSAQVVRELKEKHELEERINARYK